MKNPWVLPFTQRDPFGEFINWDACRAASSFIEESVPKFDPLEKPELSPSVVEAIDKQLINSCGGECVNTFHDLLPDIQKTIGNATALGIFLESLKSKFGGEFEDIIKLRSDLEEKIDIGFKGHNLTREKPLPNLYGDFFDDLDYDPEFIGSISGLLSGNVSSKGSQKHVSFDHNITSFAEFPGVFDGTACATQVQCDLIDARLNACTFLRTKMIMAYEGVNKIVAVAVGILKTTCGCIFSGPISLCLLWFIPYTCGMWAGGFRGLFMVSIGIWNVGRAQSIACGKML